MTEEAAPEAVARRLAQAGLANRIIWFGEALAAEGTLDEEGEALDALLPLVSGAVYRLAPFLYAVDSGLPPEALAARAREGLAALRERAAVSVSVLAREAAESEADAAVLLLGDAARSAFTLPGARRVVVDAPAAEAAARRMADRLDAVAEAAAERLEARLAAQAEARAEEDRATAARLDRLDATLERIAARLDAPAAAAARPEDVRALLAEAVAPRLDAIETRLAGAEAAAAGRVAEALAGPEFNALAAAGERLAEIEARLAALAGRGDAADAQAAEILERLADLAARPGAGVELRREREGLVRLSAALQTVLGDLDAAAARLEAPDLAGALDRQDARLSAIETRLAEPAPAEARLAALSAQVETLAERIAQADGARERRELSRLAEETRRALDRLDDAAARLDASEGLVPLLERLDSLAGALEALPEGAEAGGEAAAAALRPLLAQTFDRFEAAARVRDEEARTLAEAARRIGAACAELHGLHSRYLDATEAPPERLEPDRREPERVEPDRHEPDRFEAERLGTDRSVVEPVERHPRWSPRAPRRSGSAA